ncbi:MAG TPA: serine/threonine-protein kinase [Blastocatellia bacterium]|nr:serine/threonine-protein kinase [Blastocatellia bacterium]
MTPERYQRMGRLFDEALERAPKERVAFLDQACDNDAQLRVEVEKLLANHIQSEGFLSRPAIDVAALLLAENRAVAFLGKHLSHYRILSLLGAGGMGEVYRARDERLGRDVAIKVLPASFADDEDRLKRFEQEARATSSLNHPNILTVYDIGTHEGLPFIVEELLEGEELREALNDGAIPHRKAIEYAQQIVAGLSAAHERGIVHRDLKPENLFITKDERVKILDFGLAKLKPVKPAPGAGSELAMQKEDANLSAVIGTVGYMSPEQIRGKDTDHRSDIFSFGVILYEMLAGQRPFAGDSAVELMNAILKDDAPELNGNGKKISTALEKIMRRCLEKKPEHRFHSAHDLGFALEALSGSSSSNESVAGLSNTGSHLLWGAAGLALGGLVVATLFWLEGRSTSAGVSRHNAATDA